MVLDNSLLLVGALAAYQVQERILVAVGCCLAKGRQRTQPLPPPRANSTTHHLETLVVLQQLLGGPGGLVVRVADHAGVEHPRGGVEGVHGRVDTELRDLTRKHLFFLFVSAKRSEKNRNTPMSMHHVDITQSFAFRFALQQQQQPSSLVPRDETDAHRVFFIVHPRYARGSELSHEGKRREHATTRTNDAARFFRYCNIGRNKTLTKIRSTTKKV